MIVTTEGTLPLIAALPNEKRELTQVPIALVQKDGYAQAMMFLKYEPVEVSLEGELLGEMSAVVGGGVQFHMEGSGEYWYVSAQDLWLAFMMMLEAREGK